MQTMELNLTLITLYKYMYERDGEDTLFKYLNVPSGYDKQTLIDTILLRGGEYEVIYADGDFMQYAIKNWSARTQEAMKRIYEALTAEYNPIENYDRHEEYTDEGSGTSNGSTTGMAAHDVSGFDTSLYSPESMDTDSTETETGYSNELTHTAHVHGNIGVTTAQQMVTEQVDLFSSIEVYDTVATLFLKEFVIPVE